MGQQNQKRIAASLRENILDAVENLLTSIGKQIMEIVGWIGMTLVASGDNISAIVL
jgi:hypothetical protein